MKREIPSFSIVYETFNITRDDLEELEQSIASLYEGEITPDDALEVLVLDSGSAPPETFAALRRRFPVIEVVKVPPELALGDIRFLSQSLGRGELVATFDSDCYMESHWLDLALAAMADRPEIALLSGEVTVPIRGPYSLAIALAWIFPPFTNDSEVRPAGHYYPNACVMRREVVDVCPFPTGLPMRRGQAIVHTRRMRPHGLRVWRHPRARGHHILPRFGSILSRFLVIGHDSVELGRQSGEEGRFSHRDRLLFPEPQSRPATLARRFRQVLGEKPRRCLYLPLALPFVPLFLACYLAGRWLTRLDPERARRWLGIPLTPPEMLARLEAGRLDEMVRVVEAGSSAGRGRPPEDVQPAPAKS